MSYFEFQHEELEALGIDAGPKAASEEEPGERDTEKQKAAVAAQIEQHKDRHAGDPDKPDEVTLDDPLRDACRTPRLRWMPAWSMPTAHTGLF